MRRTTGCVVLALALVATGRLAARQDPPQSAPPAQGQRPGQRAGPRGARAGEPAPITNPVIASDDVQEMLNALVLSRAQLQLNLTADQFTAFFPRMKQLQGLRARHAKERRQLLNQLRVLTRAPEGDEATIDARTKALDALEVSMAQEEQKALALVDSGLTTWQRARFRVFEDNMENEKLRMLARVLKTPPASPPPIKK